ncbi:hypothetical protein AB0B31_05595 [Catellatospora citrea]|uniref:hypothetical protein n=1 Tax=Catellatospora citrea TaxID=53366 RepID=UPI0033D6BD5C
MPEQTEHEPLADAFFQFRMQVPDEIVVPGVPAVRRAVRRRRTARVSAVAALTALVLAAGGYSAAQRGAAAPVEPAAPSTSPSPTALAGPTLGPDQLQQLGVKALERLGLKPEKLRRGAVYGPVAAADSSGHALGTAEHPLPAGRYTLFSVCRGVGRLTVTWRADGGQGTMEAQCTDPSDKRNYNAASRVEVKLQAPGLITLSVSGDHLARGRSGFAVMVNDPLMTIAETALTRPSGDHTGGGDMFTGEKLDTNVDAKAGTYALTLTCAGTGSIKATLRMGDAGDTRTVRCSEQPSPVTITITSKRDATLKVMLVRPPDASAVAVAYYMVIK